MSKFLPKSEAALWSSRSRRPPACWPSTSCCGWPRREAFAALLRPRRPQGRRGGRGPKADLRADPARSAGADVRRLTGSSVTVEDFRGAVAAFVATADEDTDTAVHALAKAAGVPVNVADRPALRDFIMPAIVDRGGVVVAISTGGASPTLATVLRGRIEAALPERLGVLARLAATFRTQVNALIAEPARRRAFFVAWSKGRRRALRLPATRPARVVSC